MKFACLLFALTLLAGCSSPSNEAKTSTPAGATAATGALEARGVVQAVDVAAQTVKITHEPVPALKWPAMTMTFKAPTADIAGLKQGDRVVFKFTSSGMDGTITSITRQ